MSAADAWAALVETSEETVDHFTSRTGGKVHAGIIGHVIETTPDLPNTRSEL